MEVVCTPHLETSKVSKFATILNELLRCVLRGKMRGRRSPSHHQQNNEIFYNAFVSHF